MLYEYSTAATPSVPDVPIKTFDSSLYDSNKTDIFPCIAMNGTTTPNLDASLVKILKDDELAMSLEGTSHVFFVMQGEGKTVNGYDVFNWAEGDLFVVPFFKRIKHVAYKDTILYYVNDKPMLDYLGVVPSVRKFNAHFFQFERLMDAMALTNNKNNRCGIILGIPETKNTTKTLTHTMWALLNKIDPGEIQKPHRHNSVALDLCIIAKDNAVYTLIGSELDSNGNILNPTKVYWKSGSMFITPPGLWHSHHNESDEEAWVLPIQDAGIHTYMRTLDINFN